MKTITLIILLNTFLFGTAVTAQEANMPFRELDYLSYLEIGESGSDLPVMYYFYFDGCPPCERFKKALSESSYLRDFLQANFQLYSINTLDSAARQIADELDASVQPTFVILDSLGEVHRFLGFYSVPDFLKNCRYALSDGQNLRFIQEDVESGNFDVISIAEYSEVLYKGGMLDCETFIGFLDLLSRDQLADTGNVRLVYLFAIQKRDNCLQDTELFELLLDNRDYLNKTFSEDRVSGNLIWIAEDIFDKALEEDDSAKAKRIIAFIDGEGELLKRNLPVTEYNTARFAYIYPASYPFLMEVDYLQKFREYSEFEKGVEAIADEYWNNSWVLLNLSLSAAKTRPGENGGLDLAERLILRSVELEPGYENTYVQAVVYYKQGRLELAYQTAQWAIQLGEQEGWDTDPSRDLLQKIDSAN